MTNEEALDFLDALRFTVRAIAANRKADAAARLLGKVVPVDVVEFLAGAFDEAEKVAAERVAERNVRR
jgi:hypothetical protein